MKIEEEAPIEVSVFRSPMDGALVIQIDTESDDNRLRVLLNDAMIYTGNPEHDLNALATLDQLRDLFTNRDSYTPAGLLGLARALVAESSQTEGCA